MADEVIWIMPFFVAAAAIVYRVFPLYAPRWRFASLPDLFNIFKAAGSLGGERGTGLDGDAGTGVAGVART